MRRTILWSTDAIGHLLTIARENNRQGARIADAVERFERDGTGDFKKLQGGSNEWRLRVGDWRVIYEEQPGQTVILRIMNRRDAYED